MKIQILSIPRTGSAYFRSMINAQMNQFENYYSISEPFNISKQHLESHKDKDNIIQKMQSSTHVLVKSHLHELLADNYKTHIKKYLSIEWVTVCLLRKNLFEASISRMIAIETGVWNNGYVQNPLLKIDFENLKMYINDTVCWTNSVLENNLNLKYNKIVFYEDLKFNSAEDWSLLQLPIEHCHFYKTSKKYSKQQIVVNYDELKEKSQTYIERLTWK